MKTVPKCQSVFGHHFQARYDTSGAKGLPPKMDTSIGALEYFRDVTYVRDVCVRCGETIERNDGGRAQ